MYMYMYVYVYTCIQVLGLPSTCSYSTIALLLNPRIVPHIILALCVTCPHCHLHVRTCTNSPLNSCSHGLSLWLATCTCTSCTDWCVYIPLVVQFHLLCSWRNGRQREHSCWQVQDTKVREMDVGLGVSAVCGVCVRGGTCCSYLSLVDVGLGVSAVWCVCQGS